MINNLSDKELHFGYFVFKNKERVIKIAYGLWITINVLLVLLFVYLLIVFFQSIRFEKQNIFSFANRSIAWYDPTLASKTKEPKILSVQAIEGGRKAFKLIAEILNENGEWVVWDMSYHFVADGVPTNSQKGFLLPGKNYLISPVSSSRKPASIQLVQENMVWKRLSSYDQTTIRMANFDITNAKTSVSPKTGFNSVSFTVKNDSPFNFWKNNFLVIAKRGGKIIDFGAVALTDFNGMEKRDVELQIGKINLVSTDLEVIPRTNLFDDRIYRPVTVKIEPLPLKNDNAPEPRIDEMLEALPAD